MRAVVCVEPGRMELQHVPVPEPAPDEVIVRVEASGVCGSDIRGFHGRHPDIKDYPIILGHEYSGTIVALGSQASGPAIGTRVAVEPLTVCGRCRGCIEGHYQLCDNLMLNGHHYEGSFCEFTRAKSVFCFPIPDAMSFRVAAFAEPVAVAVHAVKRSRATVGDLVVVLGAGPIGNLCMQVARAAGARVLISDVDPPKLDVARATGADFVVNAATESVESVVRALTGGTGADIVMEAAGVSTTLQQTVHLARKGGTIVAVGFTADDTDSIRLTDVTIRELDFLGTVIYCRDYPATLDLLSSGRVVTEPLATHEYTLEALADQAAVVASKPSGMIKPLVLPQQR